MRSTRKVSSSGNAGSASRIHGSSLREMGAPLDQERAASMADEGGVSGAHTDAMVQMRSLPHHDNMLVAGRELRRMLPWALLFTGLAAGLAALTWAWRQRHDY